MQFRGKNYHLYQTTATTTLYHHHHCLLFLLILLGAAVLRFAITVQILYR